MISGIAGLGHIAISAGLIVFVVAVRRAVTPKIDAASSTNGATIR